MGNLSGRVRLLMRVCVHPVARVPQGGTDADCVDGHWTSIRRARVDGHTTSGQALALRSRAQRGSRVDQNRPLPLATAPDLCLHAGMLLETGLVNAWWPLLIAGLVFYVIGTEIRVRAEAGLLAARSHRRSGPGTSPYRRQTEGEPPRAAIHQIGSLSEWMNPRPMSNWRRWAYPSLAKSRSGSCMTMRLAS